MKPFNLFCGALIALLFAACSIGTASAAPPLDRSTVDRPDDVAGPQVHLIYATPADGQDHGLDASGTVANGFAVADGWFRSQTGLDYRLDTYQGNPDVSFVRLAKSDVEIRAHGYLTLEDLQTVGFNDPNKIYAVYYDGSAGMYCGTGGSRLAVMYLFGVGSFYPAGTPPCEATPLAQPGASYPGYHEFVLIHEIVHSTPPGFVASCAPHWTASNPNHTPDPTDLMYDNGSGPWDLAHLVVDPGHDDWFGENVPAGCPNLRDSPYLTDSAFRQLVVTPSPGGSVTGLDQQCTDTSPCKVPLRASIQVTLTAVAADGYTFTGWGAACSGTSPTCSVSLTGDQTVTATFTQVLVKLTVRKTGQGTVTSSSGTIKCGTSCVASLPLSQAITLRAAPAKGWKFVGWKGLAKGTSPKLTLTITAPASETATFAKVKAKPNKK